MPETPPWHWYFADPPPSSDTYWVRFLDHCAAPAQASYATDPGEWSFFNGDVYMAIPGYLAVMWREI